MRLRSSWRRTKLENVPALELEVKVVEASVAGERAVSLHGNDGDKTGELNGPPSL